MAKKKPAAAKPDIDRHKGTFLVRLPERYRDPVKTMATQTRRTISGQVQVALDTYFKANPPTTE